MHTVPHVLSRSVSLGVNSLYFVIFYLSPNGFHLFKMFKIHNEAVPSVISGMFVKRFKIINRETRQSHSFNVPGPTPTKLKRPAHFRDVKHDI